MPTQDRTMRLYRELLEAALDQPNPSPALKHALSRVMKAIEHSSRLQVDDVTYRREEIMPGYQVALEEWLS